MRPISFAVLVLTASSGVPLAAQHTTIHLEGTHALARLESLRSLASLKSLASLRSQSSLAQLQSLQGLRGLAHLKSLGDRGDGWWIQADPASEPPESWDQQDPADQLYRRAREALNSRRYEEAARSFAEVHTKYPRSSYAGDAYYWQAFALYRRGTTESLRQAREALRLQSQRAPNASTRSDALSLETRVLSELAQRGDEDAAERIQRQTERVAPPTPPTPVTSPTPPTPKTPPSGRGRPEGRGRGSCSGDDEQSAVLDALLNMDEDRAVPILKRVMARRDPGSECLRRKAVFILSQHEDAETPKLLLEAVRSDPDREVREQAVFWLSQVDLPEAVSALDSILRSSNDRDVQEKAVFALSQHDSPRAAQALRTFAGRSDIAQSLRENAIFWLSQSDDPENATFLRNLFRQVRDHASKDKIIFSISQIEGPESQRWLLQIAGDRSETIEIRKQALFWAGQMKGSPQEFFNLYETFSDREMKEQLIFVYSQMESRPAVDKLMSIARSEPDRELRKKAVFWLGQSDDPRVPDFLASLLEKP